MPRFYKIKKMKGLVKIAWEDNYHKLIEQIIPIEGNKEWRFVLEEHKNKGTMQMNVRLWQKAREKGGYEGPTKNGFIQQIKTPDDITGLEEAFKIYFDKVKEML